MLWICYCYSKDDVIELLTRTNKLSMSTVNYIEVNQKENERLTTENLID